MLGSGIAVALVGGGFAAWRMGLFDGTGPAGNSVAVLPFANLSGDPGQSNFSDGLAAEMRAELARNDLLQVVAQVSSNRFAELRSADRRRVRVAERDRRLGDGCVVCADQEAIRGCTRGPKRPVGGGLRPVHRPPRRPCSSRAV
ncbi:MAG TPA: hypothetical protein VLH36_11540 [Steroidobacteraceae bacterium]|nr:hypothetical protein [Steroidobacteraceae bacterium]